MWSRTRRGVSLVAVGVLGRAAIPQVRRQLGRRSESPGPLRRIRR